MANSYPKNPGAKGLTFATFDTSAGAAAAMALNVTHMRMVALRTLACLSHATVLQCVSAAGYPREALQPRYSELIRLGMVEPTGGRRRNPSGKSAAVLRVTEKGRDAVNGGAHD